MFDIAFSEVLLIAVVALVVLGPEKLPKVARTCGLLYSRAQQYISGFKDELEREVALQDLRKVSAAAKDEIQDIAAHIQEVHADLSGMGTAVLADLTTDDANKIRDVSQGHTGS